MEKENQFEPAAGPEKPELKEYGILIKNEGAVDDRRKIRETTG